MRNIPAVLLILILIVSCDQDEKLTDITMHCEFHEYLLTPCFYGIHNFSRDEIVIRNNAAYLKFQDSIRIEIYEMNCEDEQLPSIDFERYTLIGKKTFGGGCSVQYRRKIFDDKANNLIRYKISARYSGDCAMGLVSWNWALIPSIPDYYMVVFEVREL